MSRWRDNGCPGREHRDRLLVPCLYMPDNRVLRPLGLRLLPEYKMSRALFLAPASRRLNGGPGHLCAVQDAFSELP
jgi:hypothetical protein